MVVDEFEELVSDIVRVIGNTDGEAGSTVAGAESARGRESPSLWARAVTPFNTFFALCFASSLLCLFSFLLISRLASRCTFRMTSSSSTKPAPLPAPTHHHQPRKLCQRTTAHIRPGNQTYSSSLGMYRKLRPVLMTARKMAAPPKAAVPPSVLHACFLFMRKPQMKRAAVKSKERVALQTFRTAEETTLTAGFPLKCSSCMIAARIARGPDDGWTGMRSEISRRDQPSNVKISLPSRREG